MIYLYKVLETGALVLHTIKMVFGTSHPTFHDYYSVNLGILMHPATCTVHVFCIIDCCNAILRADILRQYFVPAVSIRHPVR